MMRAALTVREIIGLTLDSVEDSAGSDHGYMLRVRKAGGGHERTLVLDPETSQACSARLEVRTVGLSPLHPGSRLIVGDRIGRSIAPNGLYNICQAHLARCMAEKGLLAEPAPHTVLDPGLLAHMGPNTLRNTCIAAASRTPAS